MIKKYIYNESLNNISDIIKISDNNDFKKLINQFNKSELNIFINNLDNYISFIKENLYLKPYEISYIANLTLYNKHNKILLCNKNYIDNYIFFNKCFIKMIMFNYNKNYCYLKRFIKINKNSFTDLCNKINNNKKRSYVYFEIINQNNMNFFLPIIESINY